MPGLFIQRQAEALAKSHQVVVIYVQADPDCPNRFEAGYSEEAGVRIVRVYYKTAELACPAIAVLRNMVCFFMAYRRGIRIIGGFKPDIIHSHVLTRAGIVGYWLSLRFHTPHVISEHWSMYFPEQDKFRGRLRKWITRFLVCKADAIITVSEMLMMAMKAHRLTNPRYYIVPNIVDNRFFTSAEAKKNEPQKHFIHVSCFDEKSKNISGLLESVRLLRQKRTDFHCTLVGDGPDLERMKTLSGTLGLTGECVTFAGLMSIRELSELYHKADFTVISSQFETFGTVLIESLACGTPVVTTNTGIAQEVINVLNGILIPAGDPEKLVSAINRMLDECFSFDPQEVSRTIEGKFTPESVSRQLTGIYSSLITHD